MTTFPAPQCSDTAPPTGGLATERDALGGLGISGQMAGAAMGAMPRPMVFAALLRPHSSGAEAPVAPGISPPFALPAARIENSSQPTSPDVGELAQTTITRSVRTCHASVSAPAMPLLEAEFATDEPALPTEEPTRQVVEAVLALMLPLWMPTVLPVAATGSAPTGKVMADSLQLSLELPNGMARSLRWPGVESPIIAPADSLAETPTTATDAVLVQRPQGTPLTQRVEAQLRAATTALTTELAIAENTLRSPVIMKIATAVRANAPAISDSGATVHLAQSGQLPTASMVASSPIRAATVPAETSAAANKFFEAPSGQIPRSPAVAASLPRATEMPTLALQSAAVELPNGVTIRANGPKPMTSVEPNASADRLATASAAPEKIAAAALLAGQTSVVAKSTSEKHFLNTDTTRVGKGKLLVGTASAFSVPTMFAPAHALLDFPFTGQPVAALVEPIGGTTATAEAARLVAQRAVQTVTTVVEAQAASRMQPVPSVQLQFKFGEEDLHVRVTLRDGEVRTEFRTDSPELRAALTHEMRAVAGRPDSTLRFAEPFVATANSSGNNAGNGHSFSQGQSSSQHHRFRAQPDFLGDGDWTSSGSAPLTELAPPPAFSHPHRLSALA
ncbi:MAG: hypothetical protein Q8M02_06060 [Candidatus Didemnitutus sp.]|nr:hypothetical protein [Candidatus Didemnitutus sp.]